MRAGKEYGYVNESTEGSLFGSSRGLKIQKRQIPKASPEEAKLPQRSVLSDFLSSPICINLCDFVRHMDTIWTPKFLMSG